jgi:hypothetical protein
MTVVKETIKCPYCYEPINARATRCKHCHADLAATASKGKSGLRQYSTFRMGFLLGVLFSLIMGVLVYLQFNSP